MPNGPRSAIFPSPATAYAAMGRARGASGYGASGARRPNASRLLCARKRRKAGGSAWARSAYCGRSRGREWTVAMGRRTDSGERRGSGRWASRGPDMGPTTSYSVLRCATQRDRADAVDTLFRSSRRGAQKPARCRGGAAGASGELGSASGARGLSGRQGRRASTPRSARRRGRSWDVRLVGGDGAVGRQLGYGRGTATARARHRPATLSPCRSSICRAPEPASLGSGATMPPCSQPGARGRSSSTT